MASVRVAVRVRPLNRREIDMGSQSVVTMDGNKTSLHTYKGMNLTSEELKETLKEFSYDYSYWSVNSADVNYASQEQVFKDLGKDVIQSACDGYNACIFAYGQTGSGKTYTMMGNPGDLGLIPRICEGLFARMSDPNTSYRTEVSYLEIYNERVRDLLKTGAKNTHSLRVREHPKEGPFVADLSKHLVMDYDDMTELMDKGNSNRTTASTLMNDVSSRSHAIFTVKFTQAQFSKNSPSETHSKIHLVDLAGSERADVTGATGQRLKEGGSINKSLVTLGNVISVLADMSEKGMNRRHSVFVPYRDSVLTWLLKDSLGGNSRTIMIATISPAECNSAETLSTLRYANRAKNIINKPTVNEDPNVRLIKELRDEISKLRSLLGNSDGSKLMSYDYVQKLEQTESRMNSLTEEWRGRWREEGGILKEDSGLALRREGLGVVLDSQLPHLVGLDDNMLSSGVAFYHLPEGKTTIGAADVEDKPDGDAVDTENKPDIALVGMELEPLHCVIENDNGEVTLIPVGQAMCCVNGAEVSGATLLTHGASVVLGQSNTFRFNHPQQAKKLREEMKKSFGPNNRYLSRSRLSLSSQSISDLYRSVDSLSMWSASNNKDGSLSGPSYELKRKDVERIENAIEENEITHATEKKILEEQLRQEKHQLAEAMERLKQLQNELLQTLSEEKRTQLESVKTVVEQLIKEQTLAIEAIEQRIVENITDRRKQHEEELKQLESECDEKKTELIEKWRQLQELDETLSATQKNKESEERRREIEKELYKELDMVSGEKDALLRIRDWHEYHKHAANLDNETRVKLLNPEVVQLTKIENELKAKEMQINDEYMKQVATVNVQKEITGRELALAKSQLDNDKAYLKECEECYEKSIERNSDSLDSEELAKDKEAIDEEKKRIERDEKKLADRQLLIEVELLTRMDSLNEEKQRQLSELNMMRTRLEQLSYDWTDTVEQEVNVRENVIKSLRQDMAEMQQHEDVEQRRKKLEEEKRNLEILEINADEEFKQKKEFARENFRLEVLALTTQTAQLNEAKTYLEQLLSNIPWIDDEAKLVKVREIIQQYKNSGQINDLLALKDVVYNNEMKDSSLFAQLMELRKWQEKLEQSERDMSVKENRYVHDKNRQLDSLKLGRLELEDMEREMGLLSSINNNDSPLKSTKATRYGNGPNLSREVSPENIVAQSAKQLTASHNGKEESLGMNGEENLRERSQFLNDRSMFTSTPLNNSLDASGGIETLSQSVSYRTRFPSIVGVVIPRYIYRGNGIGAHYEYEIKLTVGDDLWTIYRRYSRFRELFIDLRLKYHELQAVYFPPKKLFGGWSENVAAERRIQLQACLKLVLDVLQRLPSCPLYGTDVISKDTLWQLHPFFKRGISDEHKR